MDKQRYQMVNANKGVVYFIQTADEKYVKIGYTTSLEKRLSTLSTASIFNLKLLFSFETDRSTEGELHKKFSHLRVNREWFKINHEILSYIKLQRGGVDEPNPPCMALTHIVTPVGEPTYYCCINAGVSLDQLVGLPKCRDLCECHEKDEEWRPGPDTLKIVAARQEGERVINELEKEIYGIRGDHREGSNEDDAPESSP